MRERNAPFARSIGDKTFADPHERRAGNASQLLRDIRQRGDRRRDDDVRRALHRLSQVRGDRQLFRKANAWF